MGLTKAREIEILERAIDAIYREAGVRLRLGELDKVGKGYRRYDAIVYLPDQNAEITVETKKWAQHVNLGALIDQVKTLPPPRMLVADFVNPQMAEKLRAEDVQFIDTAGNAYLNIPPTFIYVRGNRLETLELKKRGQGNKLGRPFNTTGLKVVYAFLRDPELVNAPYRDIAHGAGVAVGTVTGVIQDLKVDRYIADMGRRRGRRLIEYRALLDRWTEAYPEKLRPKQLVGNFIAPKDNWWKEVDIRGHRAWWGGEIAAAKLTDFLTPQIATVYVAEGQERKLALEFQLRTAPEGNVGQEGRLTYFYKTFWKDTDNENENDNDVVDPVLVYADLIATADTRNREVAQIIFEKYVANRIEGD